VRYGQERNTRARFLHSSRLPKADPDMKTPNPVRVRGHSYVLRSQGAGDGNRTRTISLGNQQIGASDRPDLDNRCTASDRDGPCDTGVNGPPMARFAA
jgi:hypothetical protein